MARPSLALVVLALALSTVAIAGVVAQVDSSASTPFQQTTPSEPNYLAINGSDVRASNTTALDIDVGSAIGADSTELQATYLETRFDQAYTAASTPDERTRALRTAVERLENASIRLQERNRENIRAFSTGSISPETFVRERVRITMRAETFQATVSSVDSTTSRDPTYSRPPGLRDQLSNLVGKFEVLQGPVSASATDQLTRGGDAPSIYAEVSDSGYTLASVNNGLYVRESFLGNEWQPDEADQFIENTTNAVNAAEDRAMELYPWVRLNHQGGSAFDRGDGTYRVRRTLPDGELTVYLSGGTTNVFREAQERTVTSFNTTQAVNRTEESVQLTVNRTFETGPAEIRLYDTATNTPINGTVELGNRDPVWLGDDGRLWIVEPRGDVQLNVTAGTTRFSTPLSGF